MSTPAASRYKFESKAEEYAFYRRRDHDNIEAMQNLAIAAIADEAARKARELDPDSTETFEMPPNVRHLISALQGAHGGGERAFEEFERDYLAIGAQLQFTGTDSAVRARVRRWVDELVGWQEAVCYELFSVVKGGKVVGYRDDGSPVCTKTKFIDNLEPNADDAVMRARESDAWRKGTPETGGKPHPGVALAEQVGSLLEALPRLAPLDDGANDEKETSPLPLDKYEQRQEQLLIGAVERRADVIEQRGGDDAEWIERLATLLHRVAASRRKTAPARRDYAALSIFDDEVDDEAGTEAENAGATASTCDTEEPPRPTPGPADRAVVERPDGGQNQPGNKNVTQSNIGVFADSAPAEPADTLEEWALFWAAEGIPVFPVWPVFDGVCFCKDGSECQSPGKHPVSRLAPHGVKDATVDPEVIRRWWREMPDASIGGAMGGESRLLAVDVDPRSGGSASLHDLCEAHGLDWLETLENRTGGDGHHFFFRVPPGVEFRKGKLAPGIDLKWAGGYVVLPPSVHASGRSYRITKALPVAPTLPWLVEELTRVAGAPPPVKFQEHRQRAYAGPSAVTTFRAGERNDGLFRVAFGRWVNGWAADVTELHAQLLEVNERRCSPPLRDAEVAQMVAHVAADYPRGVLREVARK